MKERQLMKGAAFMLLAATATLPAHAQKCNSSAT